jgi:hypothetical protein
VADLTIHVHRVDFRGGGWGVGVGGGGHPKIKGGWG